MKPAIKHKLPWLKTGLPEYTTDDDVRDKMRLKLIEVMQTPPKDRDATFFYNETILYKALGKANEIETAIFNKFSSVANRMEKWKSLIFKLSSKYTTYKDDILNSQITPVQLIEMSDSDFLSAEEKAKLDEQEQALLISSRSDFFRDQMKKGPKMEGFFKCRCGSKYTTFYQQ